MSNERERMIELMAKELERRFMASFYLGTPPKPPNTALTVRGNQIVSVELDHEGNVIEPCPKCGPILMCSKHMAMVP